jgi:hypothetical protein
MEKPQKSDILKDKDKKALSLFKFSKVQKLKQKHGRCVKIASALLETVISDDDNENKLDLDVAIIICSVIEFLFKHNKKYKVNKLDIALSVFEELFGALTEEQKKYIIKNVNNVITKNLLQKISKLDLVLKDLGKILRALLI